MHHMEQTEYIDLRIMQLLAAHNTGGSYLIRLLRAFSNFRLAVLEEEWDEYAMIDQNYDWVTDSPIAPLWRHPS